MTEHNPSPSNSTPPSPEIEALTAETFVPVSKPEDEVNLNDLFPDAGQDLNELFPEPELKSLLKKIHKHKDDIEKIKERFLESQDDAGTADSEDTETEAGSSGA